MQRFAVSIFLSCWIAFAQHAHHTPENSKPAELLEGLGKHVHTIATKSELAQQFFNQGLALIYGFNHDEAARLFARAAELEPKSPMPHWGIALALGSNYNMPPMPEREEKAWLAIEKAKELSEGAADNERAYIAALVKRYSKDPNEDRKQLAVTYKDAMKQLMKRYPDDLDAATLYAESLMNLRPWALWSADGAPAEGTLEVLEVLENVLRRDPEHPGANHYYIHAVEASKNPERALPSASRLGAIMPGAGHMVHMPSHIYIRVGEHELSATVNETAADVDRKYIERSGAKGVYPLMYYSHNLHFVSHARMMQGKFDQAIEYSNKLRKNIEGAVDEMPMLAPYRAFDWMVLTRFGKWKEMLEQAEPQENSAMVHALYRYARGAAFAGTNQMSEAKAERERLAALCGRIPESEMLMINTARSVAAIAMAELDARLARAASDGPAEVRHLQQAVELQDKLAYMEPPEWYFSLRESLGAALLRNGDAAAAEGVFRRDLENNPRSPRSLFGLLQSLQSQGKSESAVWVKREFVDAWKHSGLELKIDNL